MKKIALVLLCALVVLGCVSRQVREGQRLFAGCEKAVDDERTLELGVFVCKGAKDPAPFAGNGRACGSCHVPGDNFSITPKRIASLPADDPLFFPLDENPEALLQFGLIHVIAPGGIDDLRQTPKLTHLRDLCSRYTGQCDGLGLHGDRIEDLSAFTLQAIGNHLAKTSARVPGVDFRVPTAQELKALTAYQLSTLVSDQD